MKKSRAKTKAIDPPPVPAPAPVPVEVVAPAPASGTLGAPASGTLGAPASGTLGAPAKAEAKKPARVKKEKKPVQVVAVVTPNGIEGTFTPEPRRPLIVNLPFKSSEVEFNDAGAIHYDPNPPPNVLPYDTDQNAYFQVNTENSSESDQIGVDQQGWKMGFGVSVTEQANLVEVPQVEQNSKVIQQAAPPQATPAVQQQQKPQENYQRAQILACYATEKGKSFVPPETTPICCYWCAQGFQNMPCFLPVKEEGGVFFVYGNFCTPQCGLAYLLNEHLDSHVRWERMALLHRMYKSPRLYPAPPRESLTVFGGTYSYEKYREVIAEGKTRVDVHLPPMVSILGTLDTKPIDFYDSSLQNTFSSGFSLDRFKAWSEQGGALRLKRSKPLKDKDSTLDAVIQISIKRGGE